MVSLITILRTSAEQMELRIKAAPRLRRIREIEERFIIRLASARIFLLLFVSRDRHFFGFAAGIPSACASPAGKSGTAGDQTSAALVGEIGPRPLNDDQN